MVRPQRRRHAADRARRRARRSSCETPRPPRSTVQRASASSRGARASPKRWMPVRSPSARSSAWPSAMPQSSTVWCSSTCRSPLQLRSRSSRPCVASAVSMWSRKPTPVAIVERPLPSRSTRDVDGRLPRAARRRAAAAPDAGRRRRCERRRRRGPAARRGRRRAGRSRRRGDEARMTPSSSGSWPKLRTTRPREASPPNASSPLPRGAEGDVVAGAADLAPARGRDPLGQALALRGVWPRRRRACPPRARTPARPRARSARRWSRAGAGRPARRPGPGSRARSRSGWRRAPSPWRTCARRRGSRSARPARTGPSPPSSR